MFEKVVNYVGYDQREKKAIFLVFTGKILSRTYAHPYRLEAYQLKRNKYLLFIQNEYEIEDYYWEEIDNLTHLKNEAYLYLRERIDDYEMLAKAVREMYIGCLKELIANEVDNRDIAKEAKIIEVL